jgi:UrcA family protein
MKFAIALTASVLSLTTLDARASVPTGDDAPSITVQYADLDLDHKAGIVALYARLDGAARQVCGDRQADLRAKQAYRTCVHKALSAAVERIDRPMLSDYVVQRVGKPAKTAPVTVAAR